MILFYTVLTLYKFEEEVEQDFPCSSVQSYFSVISLAKLNWQKFYLMLLALLTLSTRNKIVMISVQNLRMNVSPVRVVEFK